MCKDHVSNVGLNVGKLGRKPHASTPFPFLRAELCVTPDDVKKPYAMQCWISGLFKGFEIRSLSFDMPKITHWMFTLVGIWHQNRLAAPISDPISDPHIRPPYPLSHKAKTVTLLV